MLLAAVINEHESSRVCRAVGVNVSEGQVSKHTPPPRLAAENLMLPYAGHDPDSLASGWRPVGNEHRRPTTQTSNRWVVPNNVPDARRIVK